MFLGISYFNGDKVFWIKCRRLKWGNIRNIIQLTVHNSLLYVYLCEFCINYKSYITIIWLYSLPSGGFVIYNGYFCPSHTETFVVLTVYYVQTQNSGTASSPKPDKYNYIQTRLQRDLLRTSKGVMYKIKKQSRPRKSIRHRQFNVNFKRTQ